LELFRGEYDLDAKLAGEGRRQFVAEGAAANPGETRRRNPAAQVRIEGAAGTLGQRAA